MKKQEAEDKKLNKENKKTSNKMNENILLLYSSPLFRCFLARFPAHFSGLRFFLSTGADLEPSLSLLDVSLSLIMLGDSRNTEKKAQNNAGIESNPGESEAKVTLTAAVLCCRGKVAGNTHCDWSRGAPGSTLQRA